jgi:hypothetical protein
MEDRSPKNEYASRTLRVLFLINLCPARRGGQVAAALRSEASPQLGLLKKYEKIYFFETIFYI